MAFTPGVTLETKPNASWTREERIIEKVRAQQKTGLVLDQTEITDLMNILQAVDDYAKGTNTAMDLIKTNYNAHKNDKK